MGVVSLSFLFLFLPAVFLVYFLLKPPFANAWLLVAGLFWYSLAASGTLPVLLGVVLVAYLAGVGNGKLKSTSAKRAFSGGCVLLLIAALILFRTLLVPGNLFAGVPWLAALVPLGAFFYVLQAIMYIVDTCKSEPCLFNPLDLALYISFFPKLVSGPLVPYRQFREKLAPEHRAQGADTLAEGVWRIAGGLCKKVLIADQLAGLVSTVFGAGGAGQVSVLQTWLGVAAYALQIYLDFSAYSDIAVGIGTLFGYTLPENFRQPYTAVSLKEFWRRWHITLGRFFRDYVYIPLGGSRNGTARWILSLMSVWLLTGLWHGFTWNFVIWGLGHGVLLAAEHFLLKKREKKPARRAFGHVYTLLAVALLWVFFRAEDPASAVRVLLRLFGIGAGSFANAGFLFQLKNSAVPLLLGLVCCIPPQAGFAVQLREKKWYKIASALILAAGVIASAACLYLNSSQPFLYAMF